MCVIWNFPTRVVCGVGAALRVGDEARSLGVDSVLIVTDRGVNEAGVLSDLHRGLAQAGVASSLFDDISSNPGEDEVSAATEAYKQSGAGLVLAVGGGSVLDVGKLVRLLVAHAPPLAQYDDAVGGGALIVDPMPPMIAIPTTAGTGSEVGRAAVATLKANNKKTVFFAPMLLPNVALLDPALTRSVPARLTAATGFDALTHAIEAYCCCMDHPMADAIACESIRLIVANLPRVLQNGGDLQARAAMLKASMMGAVAFQKGLGACHSLAHPLSAEHGLHHGLANALCLPSVLDFNREAAAAKLAHIGNLLGVNGGDEVSLAAQCADAIRSLRRQAGLPDGLAAVGVQTSDLERLADLAFEDACHRDNPRPCSRDDLLSLYRASL